MRCWLRYLRARQGAPRARLNLLYERALRELPGRWVGGTSGARGLPGGGTFGEGMGSTWRWVGLQDGGVASGGRGFMEGGGVSRGSPWVAPVVLLGVRWVPLGAIGCELGAIGCHLGFHWVCIESHWVPLGVH